MNSKVTETLGNKKISITDYISGKRYLATVENIEQKDVNIFRLYLDMKPKTFMDLKTSTIKEIDKQGYSFFGSRDNRFKVLVVSPDEKGRVEIKKTFVSFRQAQ